MGGVFEVSRYDAAGRLGELSVPRAGETIQTPALMPVVNPHVQTLEPARLADLGASMLITNSYVLHGSDELREPALEQGLHELLGFDGVIMTDSGSFQLAEYGQIDVTTGEILRFQHEIGSDIGTPVDVPTPPKASREQAAGELETTQDRLEQAAGMDLGEMLVTAPVQGGRFADLRERAGAHAAATGLEITPIGGVVPFMSDYRFDDLVDVVRSAKRGLGEAMPVHLFGAGHPMMFALAAAMGCDLFDSAAYALYARDGRYLTVRGTKHLEDLREFPCSCAVCTDHDPASLQAMHTDSHDRQRLLAEHNASVSLAELRRIRQAIAEGNLLELVEARARSHPAVLSGYRTLLAANEQAAPGARETTSPTGDPLEATEPVAKGTFFYLSAESARRPEVRRHHRRLERLSIGTGRIVLTEGSPEIASETESSSGSRECWEVRPPFGPIPPELAEVYPLTAELPARVDSAARASAVEAISRLVEAHPGVAIRFEHDGWSDRMLEEVPDRVETVDLTA